jgi:hypothetical protein
MQNIILNYPTSNIQKLFIAKGSELLYKGSLDTYRLKLHNPKTIIEELISVCKSTFLTNNDYAQASASELTTLLNEDNDGLKFIKVNRKYFLELLKNTKKENYNRIVQACKLILSDNTNYQEYLFDEIEKSLLTFDETQAADIVHNEQKKLLLQLTYLFVELINKGFTKQYLYKLFQVIFIYKNEHDWLFEERYTDWKLLRDRPKENYTTIFNIIGNDFQISELKKIDSIYEGMNSKSRKKIENTVSERVNTFLEDNKMGKLISINVSAFDHYKALEISREKLSRDMDLYHLGLNSHIFEIDSQAAVIGTINPEKSSTIPVNYQIDGYINKNTETFDRLLKKVTKMKENNIDDESYDKIFSAVRYLRTGSESPELETKLLNYWIGLEYIFTSINSEEKTIDRIRKYYPICHSLVYIKRNLFDFHKSIIRHGISGTITDFDNNTSIEYLTKHNSYNEIFVNSTNELLKFRALYFQKWVEDPSNIGTALKKHSDNLKWNLTRLYRIRNEIVHNAAIKNGIYVNISHMKYYLTFILNSILDFMSNDSLDIDCDGKITIEDYFIAQDIMLGSLKGSKIENYLKVRFPKQILH